MKKKKLPHFEIYAIQKNHLSPIEYVALPTRDEYGFRLRLPPPPDMLRCLGGISCKDKETALELAPDIDQYELQRDWEQEMEALFALDEQDGYF